MCHWPDACRLKWNFLPYPSRSRKSSGCQSRGWHQACNAAGYQSTPAGASCGHALAKQPAEKHHDGGGRGAVNGEKDAGSPSPQRRIPTS